MVDLKLFEIAKQRDTTGKHNSVKISYRLEWIIGTILTAGRRKSFICNSGGRFLKGYICYFCQLTRLHLHRKNHVIAIWIMRKTGRVFVHSHIGVVRYRKNESSNTGS